MKKFLIFALFWLGYVSIAQDTKQLNLDEAKWEEITRDVDYSEENKKPDTTNQNQEKSKDWNPDFSGLKPLFFVLIIALVLVVLFLIIRKSIARMTPVSKTRLQAKNLEDAEENLPDVTLDNIYNEAVSKSDFKLALRIKFLMVLQKMIDKGFIIWRKRKTNQQYIGEIKELSFKLNFTHIVNVYDDAWYGSAPITEDRYNGLITRIDELNQTLHNEK